MACATCIDPKVKPPVLYALVDGDYMACYEAVGGIFYPTSCNSKRRYAEIKMYDIVRDDGYDISDEDKEILKTLISEID